MLDRLRLRLSNDKALPLLALLGLVCGVAAATIIVLFRLWVEGTQGSFLPGGDSENYEAISPLWRLLLATGGGLLIGILFQQLSPAVRSVGVVHVMERLSYFQGHMPWKNALAQFIGAGISIISGHSVGREGPGILLGAAAGSLMGQGLTLPNNSIRILVASGSAGAIAASFNTPLAGVIFAMEVVMMEYTVTGITPVILAAVSATVVTRAVFGPDPGFTVPMLDMLSMGELPYVLIMGLLIGALAALFISMIKITTFHTRDISFWKKTTLAGFLMGLCAIPAPQIMGIGYDTVTSALAGELALSALMIILVFKLLATAIAVGTNTPGGLIGPTMYIGAIAGGMMGLMAQLWSSTEVSSSGFYALLGLGAMMAASLQAPLAALIAMLELTNNSNIILPGMLVVITASITASHLFRVDPLFTMLMRARGLDYRVDPITQALQRVSVMEVYNKSFVQSQQEMDMEQARNLLQDKPKWIIITSKDKPDRVLRAADLARYLEDKPEAQVDLEQVPGERFEVAPVYFQANLREALDIMDEQNLDMVYVWRHAGPGITRIMGIISRKAVENSYR